LADSFNRFQGSILHKVEALEARNIIFHQKNKKYREKTGKKTGGKTEKRKK
jgi:hypothetical protein